uniref:hypothetical protein n=1 Tax=Porodaedalea niemelaei TaxID=175858 RepID=UPI0023AA261A|nr:hypothetical protein P1R16_mgp10 [Porodaedalea niemelaei]YP_010697831.1 hypothetical protein P1S03_mgp14 [Porodaedalea chrysoloma]WCF76682.1 hypothetical protein [Porodaedalea niemelaei]WCF76792.1 hypothetical protein [Porodaedalea chrysoloma]
MKIKTINLKSNRINLRDHTSKFFQQTKFNSNYDSKDQILINYIETNKESYDNYIKQISNSNNLDLDSGNELSLAISINCLSGTFKKQNSNFFSVLLVVEFK